MTTPDTATASLGQTERRLPIGPLRIGIAGASGNVGTMMLRVLLERGIEIASLRAFASPRSAGSEVVCGDHSAQIEVLDQADPGELDVVLFSAGGQRSLDHARRFADAGAVVIDNSSAWRLRADVPLVVPEVNGADALRHNGIIANPNCSTIQLVVALKPLLDAAGLERVQVTSFQSVSGTGHAAMSELQQQSTDVLEAVEPTSDVYPRQIAFNVLPHCGDFQADGATTEEQKFVDESRKILHQPDLKIVGTCVRVPVFVAHSEAVYVQTRDPLSPEQARELLRAAPGVIVADDPAAGEYPTALDAAGQDEVFVGRIRRDPSIENGLVLWVVADNLRKGAATNAVQILQALQA